MSCIPLAGSSMCPDFAAYSAYIPNNTLSTPTVEAFDQYLGTRIAANSGDASSFGTFMRTTLGCANWDGSGLRYHQSALCAAFVTGLGTGSICNASPVTPSKMCASTVTAYVTSFNAVLASSCPSTAAANAAAETQLYANTATLLSSDSTCTIAQSIDRSNCGFQTILEKTSYCATATGKADTICCGIPTLQPLGTSTALFVPAPAAASATAVLPVSQSPSGGTTQQQQQPQQGGAVLPIPIIVGAGGTAIFLLVVTFICICAKKSRAAKRNAELGLLPDGEDSGSTKSVGKKVTVVGPASSNVRSSQQQQQSYPMKSLGTPAATPQFSRPVSSGKDVHAVVFNYFAQLEDELAATVGDMVIIKASYEDGWAYGFNTRTMKEGFFPLGILSGFADQQQQQQKPLVPSLMSSEKQFAAPSIISSDGNRAYNKRSSSILILTEDSPIGSKKPSILIPPPPSIPVPPGVLAAAAASSSSQGSVKSSTAPQSPIKSSSVPQSPLRQPPSAATIAEASIVSTGSQPPRRPPTQPKSPVAPAKVRIVMFNFEPVMADEIALRTGDQVQIDQEFDDGWATGKNLNTGAEGVLPTDCLMGYAPLGSEQGDTRKHSNRMSSLYGEPASYNLPGSDYKDPFSFENAYSSSNAYGSSGYGGQQAYSSNSKAGSGVSRR